MKNEQALINSGKLFEQAMNKAIKDYNDAQAKLLEFQEATELATKIHSAECHENHTDGCGWQWENGGVKWEGSAHKAYLTKARKIMKDENITMAAKHRKAIV